MRSEKAGKRLKLALHCRAVGAALLCCWDPFRAGFRLSLPYPTSLPQFYSMDLHLLLLYKGGTFSLPYTYICFSSSIHLCCLQFSEYWILETILGCVSVLCIEKTILGCVTVGREEAASWKLGHAFATCLRKKTVSKENGFICWRQRISRVSCHLCQLLKIFLK